MWFGDEPVFEPGTGAIRHHIAAYQNGSMLCFCVCVFFLFLLRRVCYVTCGADFDRSGPNASRQGTGSEMQGNISLPDAVITKQDFSFTLRLPSGKTYTFQVQAVSVPLVGFWQEDLGVHCCLRRSRTWSPGSLASWPP